MDFFNYQNSELYCENVLANRIARGAGFDVTKGGELFRALRAGEPRPTETTAADVIRTASKHLRAGSSQSAGVLTYQSSIERSVWTAYAAKTWLRAIIVVS